MVEDRPSADLGHAKARRDDVLVRGTQFDEMLVCSGTGINAV